LRSLSRLSGQVIDRIIKELGIRVTPHQFRHLAAEKDPANYEFVRRVLGHKNLQTTINFYVGLETVARNCDGVMPIRSAKTRPKWERSLKPQDFLRCWCSFLSDGRGWKHVQRSPESLKYYAGAGPM
jgi:hypothetical protein